MRLSPGESTTLPFWLVLGPSKAEHEASATRMERGVVRSASDILRGDDADHCWPKVDGMLLGVYSLHPYADMGDLRRSRDPPKLPIARALLVMVPQEAHRIFCRRRSTCDGQWQPCSARNLPLSEMDADVKGSADISVSSCWSWWWSLGSGGWCDGNDDCHSEMRGSEPQDSVRSLSCLELAARVG